MDTLLIVLCRSRTAQRISLKSLIHETNDESTKQLEEMLDAVESSAFNLISLVQRFLSVYRRRYLWAEDIAIVLECTDTALNLPHEERLLSILPSIVVNLKYVTKQLVTHGLGPLKERELVSNQASKVLDRLDAILL